MATKKLGHRHDWPIAFVPMLNFHRCVQIALNPKTVKINFHSDNDIDVYMFLFMKKIHIENATVKHCLLCLNAR